MNKVILMPVDIDEMDLSDKAIAYADHMLDKENGHIHLLHVFPKIHIAAMRGYMFDVAGHEDHLTALGRDKMLDLALKFKTPIERIHLEVQFGSIRDAVNDAVKNHNADIIIVGSSKPGIANHLLGSSAASIVRYSKIPVLVVR